MKKKLSLHFDAAMLPIIFTLALPTMLEQLMQTAVQYIDTAMVGSLGTSATAAVGSTTTVNWLLGSTISALGVGFLSFIARAYGEGKGEKAASYVTQATVIVLITGSFFTVLTLSLSGILPTLMQVDVPIRALASRYFFILYLPMLPRTASIIYGTVLRAAGNSTTPMLSGIIVNAVNLILNFLLIFPTREITVFSYTFIMPGAGLGVTGAAIASAAAFTVGGILLTTAIWRHPVLSPKGRPLRLDMKLLKPCLKLSLPNMLQRFGTSLGYVVFAAMINSLGETATAAHTVANTVESAFYVPGYGMQTAAATLAGNALGAKDNKKMHALGKTIIPLEAIFMIISGAALFIFAPFMIKIFSVDENVIRLGTTVLRMVALSEPVYGVSIIIEGMMLGVGKTLKPFIYNISGMWGIRILGTFICIRFFALGLEAAWGCMILHNCMLFIMFLTEYKRKNRNPLYIEETNRQR